MAVHVLKIERPYYDAILSGRKTFEIRINDRGYQSGDRVILRCLNDTNSSYDNSMRNIDAVIGYVSHYRQKDDWCVFSLNDVELIN